LRRTLAAGGRPRIVFVGSSSGYLAAPLIGAYNASKFAIEGICDSWRQELAPFGIDVTLIEPGAIDTPIFEASNRDAADRLAKLPADAQTLYAPLVTSVQETMARRVGAANPARTVALAVEEALRAERPSTRRRVGADATVQWVLARWLGDRLRDRVMARFLGLPQRRS
jgi:NAD(P)-dependent dehydrogenase (short-subunit alcohol dehydrogenase family)